MKPEETVFSTSSTYKSTLMSYVTQGLHQLLGPQSFEPSFLHSIYSLQPKGVNR